jgi:hypothetical protein
MAGRQRDDPGFLSPFPPILPEHEVMSYKNFAQLLIHF